jgi:hypothetical protein
MLSAFSTDDRAKVFPASDPNRTPVSPAHPSSSNRNPAAAPAGSVPGTGGASQPVSDVGNPFQLADILKDLDAALGRAVSAIAGEQHSGEPDPIVTKLTGWRDEVASMLQHGGAGPNARAGASADGPTAQEGGLYAD